MNKYNRLFSMIITIIGIVMAIISMTLLLIDDNIFRNKSVYSYIIVAFIATIVVQLVFIILERIKRNTEEIYDKTAFQLNELIKYNKQRDEIEEEIRLLTKQLINSDVAQYVDVNRLAFSGQNNIISNSINYENFLKQFGLEKDKLVIREGTAAFLTPFDKSGNMLFNTCQSILGKIDIFLRKTDNIVEKDDILMNIVSLIVQSEFVLVNIDGRNPNVYYELGIAHALGKPTILLSKARYSLNDIGFDVRQKRIIIYENEKDLETQLFSQISMIKRNQI